MLQKGDTALIYAACRGHDEAIRALVMEGGAPLGLLNKVGDGCLSFGYFFMCIFVSDNTFVS